MNGAFSIPASWVNRYADIEPLIERGGPGSGHHEHEGRPGEVGGSLPSGEVAVADHPSEWFSQNDYQSALKRVREIQNSGGFAIVTRIGANFVVMKDVEAALDQYAKDIREYQKENLYLLDTGKGQMFNKEGTKSAVRFSYDEQTEFKGFRDLAHERGDRIVAIHNHVSRHGLDFPPSMSDFQFAMGFGMDEFRIAAKTGQWIVRNTGKVEKFGGSHMEEIAKAWTDYAKENLERMTGITGTPYTLKEPEHRKRMLEDAEYATVVTDFHKQRFLDVTSELGWYETEWKPYDE